MNQHNSFNNSSLYKSVVSILLGFLGFVGIFYSSRFDFNGFSINFTWSIALPLLVALAWGIKYGILSITLGLVALYPFILGRYNGWASMVAVISLYLWIIIHGYGGQKRLQVKKFYYNIYFLQLIHIVIRMLLYVTLFESLIKLNSSFPPFWNLQAYCKVETGIVVLFAVKGIIVESILVALCDALLLLPFVRKIFGLRISRGAKYNTRIMMAIVAFGLGFSLIILGIQNYIIDKIHPLYWLINTNEKTRLTFFLAVIFFFIMGGITLRFVQRMFETQEEIKTLNDELEQRVQDRTCQLQNAVNELEGFAYTISHDLKAPLRAIDMYSSFIKEDYGASLNAEAGEMVEGIQKTSREMIGLISRLLDYSITSKTSLSKERVDAKYIIGEVWQQFKVMNPNRKMELIIEGDLPEIYVDKVLFKQVIVNIISNAVKFTKHRELAVITVGCLKERDEYIFSIKDNGAGFDMKYSSKLFNVFQRLHRKQEFEGTGIGLAAVKKIIQKHGGRVWIEGKVNEGAGVYFTIPLTEDEVENA